MRRHKVTWGINIFDEPRFTKGRREIAMVVAEEEFGRDQRHNFKCPSFGLLI